MAKSKNDQSKVASIKHILTGVLGAQLQQMPSPDGVHLFQIGGVKQFEMVAAQMMAALIPGMQFEVKDGESAEDAYARIAGVAVVATEALFTALRAPKQPKPTEPAEEPATESPAVESEVTE